MEIEPIKEKEPVKEVEPIKEKGSVKEKFDLKKFYEKYKAEFEAWLKKRIDPETAEKYIKAIDSYLPEGVKEPKDLDEPVKKTKYLPNGLRNFLNFLEEQHYITELNGLHFSIWKKHMPTKPQKEKEEKKEAEEEEEEEKIFLTNEQVAEAYKLVKEKWKDEATELLFKLIVFSGIRFEHAYRILKTFNPKKLEFHGDVAVYPTGDVAKGYKLSFYAFMPAEFAKKLKRFDKLLAEGTYKSRLQPSRWKPPKDNPASVVRLRSWFQNFARGQHNLKFEAVEYMVGHKPQTVAERHYLDLFNTALEEYRKIVDKFPIPP